MSGWIPARGVDDKDYKSPFRFTGKLDKLTIKETGPSQLAEPRSQGHSRSRTKLTIRG